jgi:hypothetical protein
MTTTRKLRRAIAYYLCTLSMRLRSLPFTLFFRSTSRLRKCWRFGGFSIYDMSWQTRDTEEFFNFAKRGFLLIEELDPRRFRVLQANITSIINIQLHTGGKHRLFDKACHIDYWRITKKFGSELGLRYFACTLVDSATRGVLHTRKIPVTNQNLARVRRAGLKEALRFARKFKDQNFDWEQYFLAQIESADKRIRLDDSTYWQRMRWFIREFRQRLRD